MLQFLECLRPIATGSSILVAWWKKVRDKWKILSKIRIAWSVTKSRASFSSLGRKLRHMLHVLLWLMASTTIKCTFRGRFHIATVNFFNFLILKPNESIQKDFLILVCEKHYLHKCLGKVSGNVDYRINFHKPSQLEWWCLRSWLSRKSTLG